MKRIVIGILAHVDSGKTTLSESILYKTGVIRKPGRVDHGSACLDSNDIERDRGITIFSSQAVFTLGDAEFTLLDTPGHIDFSPEMERTLKVLDYAVLVVSGSDGIQSHTETLWQLLGSYSIPTFIFVNKMDISPHTREDLLGELERGLSDACIDLSRKDSAEAAAVCGEELMESYLAGEPFSDAMIADAVAQRKLFPCCFGSALRSEGTEGLLSALSRYTKAPEYKKDFAAKVYKITTDDSGERLTHLKLTGGGLSVRDIVSGTAPDGGSWSEKVNSIRIYTGAKYKTVNDIKPGTVCAVTGLSLTYPGEGLGDEPDSGAAHLEPVLSYKVLLPDGTDIHTALVKLRALCEEEPELHIEYSEQLSEIRVRIMGEVQLEVLRRLIPERCGFEVDFSDGGIAYRETVAEPVIGVGHYEPLRHYAEVQLLLEPLPRGSGLRFSSDLSENQLDLNWQRLVLTHLHEKTHIGVLTGSPITDMKITLVAGRAHQKHTEGGDFRQATYRALRQGLMSAKSLLLEPWYDFRIEVPSDCTGKVMTDIIHRSGRLEPTETIGDRTIITGQAPVSELRGYHRELIGFTKGRGKLSCILRGWEECHNSDEVIAAFGYDPERDTENPADSVFCSHGAGVVVKWNEVPAHKHLDPGIELDSDAAEISARAERYMKTVATDAELMAIFERTYGPIKKRSSEPTVVKAAPKPTPIKRAARSYGGKEYLLVDGYNIIFAWDELKKLAGSSLDLAREELINRLCSYRGFRQCEVIVVFDAYRVKGNPGELERRSGVSVVYTKEAETADTYIEKVSHELAKDNRVRVATSDGQEQLIILGNGAIRISANSFHAELTSVEREIRDYLSGEPPLPYSRL